jgi:hypothetical protein
MNKPGARARNLDTIPAPRGCQALSTPLGREDALQDPRQKVRLTLTPLRPSHATPLLWRCTLRAKYLLPCSCGRETPVETTQAGEQIVCECGASLEVPTLARLTKLKRHENEPVVYQASSSTWGVRHGWIMVGSIVLALGLLGEIYLLTWGTPPKLEVQRLSTFNTWRLWMHLKQGVQFRHPIDVHRDELLAVRTQRMVGSGLAAAAGIGVILGAWLLVPAGTKKGGRRVSKLTTVQSTLKSQSSTVDRPRDRESGPGRSARKRRKRR